MARLPNGTMFAGRYHIDQWIGAGGMAEVYRAQDTVTKELVALKLLKASFLSDNPREAERNIKRFQREANILEQLKECSYVVNLVDHGQSPNGDWYIAMEYLHGDDLRLRIRPHSGVPEETFLPLAVHLTRGLAQIHGAGFLHRDLAPDNIKISPSRDGGYLPRFLDFGIGKSLSGMADGITVGPMIMGKPSYFPPEQARGQELSAASDIYALGVVLFEMATGELPIDGVRGIAELKLIVKEPPRAIDQFEGGQHLAPRLRATIMACLAKRPADRPSLDQLQHDLEAAMNDRSGSGSGTIAIPPPQTPARTPRPRVATPSFGTTDLTGQSFGRYEIRRRLGKGGMGAVYLAWDPMAERHVAIKVPSGFTEDDTGSSLIDEARKSSQLGHENIVTIYDVAEDPQPFIAMEYVDGETLEDLLNRSPAEGAEMVYTIASAVLSALDYAHTRPQPIVHLDLKPANILLGREGQIKVTDFGIARKISGATQGGKSEVLGGPTGTVAYMSPEQARGEKADQRADLYSLGCVLYRMTAKRPPFEGENELSVMYQKCEKDPVPPTKVNPKGSTKKLDQIIMKLLRRNAGQRYQKANEVLSELQALFRPTEVARPIHKSPVALLGLIAILGVLGFAGTHYFRDPGSPEVTNIIRNQDFEPGKPVYAIPSAPDNDALDVRASGDGELVIEISAEGHAGTPVNEKERWDDILEQWNLSDEEIELPLTLRVWNKVGGLGFLSGRARDLAKDDEHARTFDLIFDQKRPVIHLRRGKAADAPLFAGEGEITTTLDPEKQIWVHVHDDGSGLALTNGTSKDHLVFPLATTKEELENEWHYSAKSLDYLRRKLGDKLGSEEFIITAQDLSFSGKQTKTFTLVRVSPKLSFDIARTKSRAKLMYSGDDQLVIKEPCRLYFRVADNSIPMQEVGELELGIQVDGRTLPLSWSNETFESGLLELPEGTDTGSLRINLVGATLDGAAEIHIDREGPEIEVLAPSGETIDDLYVLKGSEALTVQVSDPDPGGALVCEIINGVEPTGDVAVTDKPRLQTREDEVTSYSFDNYSTAETSWLRFIARDRYGNTTVLDPLIKVSRGDIKIQGVLINGAPVMAALTYTNQEELRLEAPVRESELEAGCSRNEVAPEWKAFPADGERLSASWTLSEGPHRIQIRQKGQSEVLYATELMVDRTKPSIRLETADGNAVDPGKDQPVGALPALRLIVEDANLAASGAQKVVLESPRGSKFELPLAESGKAGVLQGEINWAAVAEALGNGDGRYVVSVTASDRAMNQAQASFGFDLQAPALAAGAIDTSDRPKDAGRIVFKEARVRVAPKLEGHWRECEVRSGEETLRWTHPDTAPKTLALGAGQGRIRYFLDGQELAERSLSYRVDTTKPSFELYFDKALAPLNLKVEDIEALRKIQIVIKDTRLPSQPLKGSPRESDLIYDRQNSTNERAIYLIDVDNPNVKRSWETNKALAFGGPDLIATDIAGHSVSPAFRIEQAEKVMPVIPPPDIAITTSGQWITKPEIGFTISNPTHPDAGRLELVVNTRDGGEQLVPVESIQGSQKVALPGVKDGPIRVRVRLGRKEGDVPLAFSEERRFSLDTTKPVCRFEVQSKPVTGEYEFKEMSQLDLVIEESSLDSHELTLDGRPLSGALKANGAVHSLRVPLGTLAPGAQGTLSVVARDAAGLQSDALTLVVKREAAPKPVVAKGHASFEFFTAAARVRLGGKGIDFGRSEVSAGELRSFVSKFSEDQILDAALANYDALPANLKKVIKRPSKYHVADLKKLVDGKLRPVPDNMPVRNIGARPANAFALAVGGRLPLVSEWEAAVENGGNPSVFLRSQKTGGPHPTDSNTDSWGGILHLRGNMTEWAMTPSGSIKPIGGNSTAKAPSKFLMSRQNGAQMGLRVVWDVKE